MATNRVVLVTRDDSEPDTVRMGELMQDEYQQVSVGWEGCWGCGSTVIAVGSFTYALELKNKTFEVSSVCLELDCLWYFARLFLVLSLATHYFV